MARLAVRNVLSTCRRVEGKHYVGLLIDEESPDFVNWTRMFQLDF
jgi:hypothetical protein